MSKPLPITELVHLVGDENITIQNVAHNLTGARKMKDHVVLAIATSPEVGADMMRAAAGVGGAKYVGLILWMSKERVDAIYTEHQKS